MRLRRSDTTKTARRRLEVRRALKRYPDLPSSTVDDLVHWFRSEATANEVTAMTRQLNAHDSFEQFRRAHIQKLNPALRAGAATIVMVLIACLAIGVAAF